MAVWNPHKHPGLTSFEEEQLHANVAIGPIVSLFARFHCKLELYHLGFACANPLVLAVFGVIVPCGPCYDPSNSIKRRFEGLVHEKGFQVSAMRDEV